MDFNDSAAPTVKVTPANVFRLFPVSEEEQEALYCHMILLSEGTTGVDKERGFRQNLAVAGYRVLEPFYKAIPQAAIDDRTIHSVQGVHYNFEEYFASPGCSTEKFFVMHRDGDEAEKIKLTAIGKVALAALEQKYKDNPKYGTVAQFIAKVVGSLNNELTKGGHTAVVLPSANDSGGNNRKLEM